MTSCGGGTISYGLGRKHDAVTGLLSLRERLTELGTIPLPEATAAARVVLDELRANGKAREASVERLVRALDQLPESDQDVVLEWVEKQANMLRGRPQPEK